MKSQSFRATGEDSPICIASGRLLYSKMMSLSAFPEAAEMAALAAWATITATAAWVVMAVFRAFAAWMRFRSLANRFPGPRAWPLVGNLMDGGQWNTPYMFLSNTLRHLKTHPAVQMWMGPLRIIFLSDPDDIQTFLRNHKHERSPHSALLQSTFGKGLITLSGDTWRRHKKIISPAFTTNLLDSFVTIFEYQGDVFVDTLRKHAESGAAFDLEPMVDSVAFDSLCETVMGLKKNTQEKGDSDFFRVCKIKMAIAGKRILSPWLLPDFIFRWSSLGRETAPAVNEMKKRRDELIRERQEILNANGTDGLSLVTDSWGRKRQLAFLDMLLAQRTGTGGFTDEEIGDEVDTFMLVGQDATAAFFLQAFNDISQRPEVQEKIVQELHSVFSSTGHLEFTPDNVKQLVYLEMVIKEVFRLHPPVWVSTIRRAATDVTLPSSGLVLPAGADVIIAMRGAHMKPEHWTNPEVFDPERFSPENSAKRHPYAFLPFCGGKHICIGRRFAMLETMIVIAKALWHYELLADPTYRMQENWAMATRPTNGLRVLLRHRTH